MTASSRWPRSSFLGSLTVAERETLLSLGSGRVYPPGRVILRQGEAGEFVVVILQGIAKVNVVAETGQEMLVGLRGPGDLIGEMATISGESRSASVNAATELHGIVITARSFVAHLGRAPGVASRMTQVVADRLRVANRRRLEFSSYKVEGRVAKVVVEVARAYGHPEGASRRIGAEITQADLASLSSASLRTVEKVLRLFEREGLVMRKRRDLVVIDAAALEARAEHFSTIPS